MENKHDINTNIPMTDAFKNHEQVSVAFSVSNVSIKMSEICDSSNIFHLAFLERKLVEDDVTIYNRVNFEGLCKYRRSERTSAGKAIINYFLIVFEKE